MRVGMQVRSALVLTIFQKSSVLSPKSREGRSTGTIVNLVSTDCESLQMVTQNMHTLWSSPLRIVIALYLLYGEMGAVAFIALAILVLMLPVQKT